jgi:Ca-activated chloride channel family protein
MQRWQLFTGFALTGLLVAAIVPNLGPRTTAAPDQVAFTAQPPIAPKVPAPTNAIAAVGPLSLSARLDQTSLVQGVDGERFMVLEIGAPEVEGDVSRPVDITVVMDVSSSMAGRGKITNSRKAVAELIDQLRPTDTFSLVTFSNEAQVDIRAVPVTQPERLKRQVQSIRTHGGTNIHDGIELGLAQAQSDDPRRTSRVILLSDGLATVGRTDSRDILRATGTRVRDGISVSTIGLGVDFDENLMMAMSDTGGGSYTFVDRPGQLSEMFASELRRMTQVVGTEVALTVDLGPGVELLEVYGYDKSTVGDETTIFIGAVHGGERRKVVARVRIPDSTLDTVDVADVALRYVNAGDGGAGMARADLDALIVEDTAVAKGSIDKDVGVLAARAAANSMRANSAQAYASGDSRRAQRDIGASRSLLRRLADRYQTTALDEDIDEMDAQAAAFQASAPSSTSGRRATKKAKEAARVRSR